MSQISLCPTSASVDKPLPLANPSCDSAWGKKTFLEFGCYRGNEHKERIYIWELALFYQLFWSYPHPQLIDELWTYPHLGLVISKTISISGHE